MRDPVCGNCFEPLSKHIKECETYFCNHITTGDVFDSEPSEQWLNERIVENALKQNPELYEQMIAEWQLKNGHL